MFLDQLTSGYYETSAPNSPEYVQSGYHIEAPNFSQNYYTIGRTTSREKQTMSFVSAAGASLLDYSEKVLHRKMQEPPTIYPINKPHQQLYHATNDSRVAHRNQMKPAAVHSPVAYKQDFPVPVYDDDPKCHAYQYLQYLQYPSHTIQPRTSTELRYATSSPHATSEPEQLPTYYAGHEAHPRETTVIRYFSETDGLLDNSRKHQYPPSPAPMEHLIAADDLPMTQALILAANR